MIKFDKIKTQSIDEFVEWFDKYCAFGETPWTEWFDKTYCDKCEPVMNYAPYLGRDAAYGWCELNGKCKYFQEMDSIPDNKQILKMWLELEVEE